MPPEVSSLTSATHPDQALYYSNSAPALSWAGSDVTAVAGYSYMLDQTAGTVPATTIDSMWPSPTTSTSFTGLADGVWYFHLRVCNQVGIWSATTTYTIGIDTIAPVTTDNSDDLTHTSFNLVLTPKDMTSGVAGTKYRVDSGPWRSGRNVQLSGAGLRHRRAGLAAGSHTIQYYSTDKAGNIESVKSCQVILG